MKAATVETVSFKKKISVIFSNGARKQNLNVNSAVELVKNQPTVKVTVDSEEPAASDLYLAFLKATSGTMTQAGILSLVKEAPAAAPITDEMIQRDQAADVVASEGIRNYVNERDAQPVAEPVTEAVVAEEIASEAKAEEAPAEPKQVVGYIILGPKDVYTDAKVALADIKRGPFVDAPAKYNNKVTKTFQSGSPEGQIKSLFHDFKLYGAAVAPKLKEYATFVLNTVWPSDSAYAKYVAAYRNGVLPTNPVTFVNGRVSMDYFKFWALINIAESL